ncbi:hypothetical protein T439DRAFT_13606 [Meredithblackwellia eburnea MCA 4105]
METQTKRSRKQLHVFYLLCVEFVMIPRFALSLISTSPIPSQRRCGGFPSGIGRKGSTKRQHGTRFTSTLPSSIPNMRGIDMRNGPSNGRYGGPNIPADSRLNINVHLPQGPGGAHSPGPETPIARDLSAGNREGTQVHDPTSHIARGGDFSLDQISAWDEAVKNKPDFRLAEAVLSRSSMNQVLVARETEVADIHVFNTQVSTEGAPVANQLKSGRCWLFACTNVIRIFTARKHKLGDFQLSQSYLWFYDHLSKANYFLEQALDLADRDLTDEYNKYLFKGDIVQDGGQYDLAVNLILKYGLVPQAAYPESWNSSHSDQVDGLVLSKVREFALKLRKMYNDMTTKGGLNHDQALAEIDPKKEKMLGEIYRILATCAGRPPHPNEQIVWEYRDKHNHYKRLVTTPLDFARDHCGYKVEDGIALVHDPRNEYGKLYTVERLGNVVHGAREIRYINVDIETLKKCAADSLKDDHPVWFGSDVGKAASFSQGILDTALYNYNDAFGTKLNMDKKARMETGDSAMDHAMMLTGVHIVDGHFIRWRVENSWGPEACHKGFFVMSDDWFTENVFQVVARRKYVPPSLVMKYDDPTSRVIALKPWDPMGTLAGRLSDHPSVQQHQRDNLGRAMRALGI